MTGGDVQVHRGRVDAALLPASGLVSGGELRFEVRPLAGDRDRAAQLRRLAFRAWDRDEFDRARLHGAEALAVAPGDVGRDAVDASWVMASANLALGDLRGSLEALRNLERLSSTGLAGDARTLATTLIDAIAPSLRLARPAQPGSVPDLEVYGHAGQTYEVQVSTDLTSWLPLDRRTPDRSPYRVADPGAPGGTTPRFYRVLWLP